MAYEKITRTFAGLGGQKQSRSLKLLSEIHSPSGTKNVRLDARHRVRKSEGYTKLTASTIDAKAVRSIFSFRYESGGAMVSELIAVADDTAYEVDVSTGSPTTLGTGVDGTEFPVAARLGDTLYITSGGSANVKSWDGASWGSAGGSQPTTGSIADGGSGGNHTGTYYMKYTYIQADNTEGIASAVSSPLLLEGRDITATVTNGAAGTQGKVIYLTTGDSPQFFYFAGIIDDNSTTTLGIDLTDVALILGQELLLHGDGPPTGVRVCCAAAGMLFVGNKDGNRSTMWPSDIGLPESFWDLRRLSINKQDGDELTHLEPEFSRVGETQRVATVTAFKRWGIWNLFGVQPFPDDPDPFTLEKSKSPVGAVSSAAVVKVQIGDDNVLAFIAPDKSINIYDGYKSVPISDDVLEDIEDMNLRYADQSWAAVKPSLNLAIFVYPKGSSTRPNYGLAWDYKRNFWFPYPDWTDLAGGVLHYDANDTEYLFAGQAFDTTGGFIYEMFKGTNFDGSAFVSRWRSKPILGDDPREKEMISVTPLVQQASSVNMTWKAWAGYADPDTETEHMSTTMSATESGVTHRKEELFLEDSNGDPIVDEELRIECSDNSQATAWVLLSFDVEYMAYPKKKVQA